MNEQKLSRLGGLQIPTDLKKEFMNAAPHRLAGRVLEELIKGYLRDKSIREEINKRISLE